MGKVGIISSKEPINNGNQSITVKKFFFLVCTDSPFGRSTKKWRYRSLYSKFFADSER